jgi:predicted ATPase/signal transduction histidine kinase
MDASRYTIAETLSSGHGTALCRAIRNSDRLPVVLKLLDPRQHSPKDFQRLRREFEVGQDLGSPAVVKPLELETHDGMPTLAMEDFGGRVLEGILGPPMDVARFLDVATAIAEDVADIHRRGVIHGDLKPSNIVLNPITGQVKIADLGLASRVPREMKAAQPPQLIEGSLPYMAPEQTGRMNRAVDSRSDLYSLGVTFYQMLTGRLPFEAGDPLEWVHCHIAQVPTSPADVVPGLPEPIAHIVQKLLAKMGDERYQTARGLKHDLVRCAEQWRRTGRIEPFTLGELDVPDQLRTPQKLYGREHELAELLATFERVVVTARAELLLVSGYSGLGKSSLVRELQEPVARSRGVFLSGKFDEQARDIPYSTIIHAFRQLVLDLLAEDDEHQQRRREELLRALGKNGKLIADLIPPLELLVGEQPPVAELPLADEERRFRRVILDFLGVFARPEHPLVLFLDDLQWADAASLELTEAILAAPEIRNLLVVGAYRDAEVAPGHPLTSCIDRVRGCGAAVTEIVLSPLSMESLVALVADTLRTTAERARSLAEMVHDKTGGNPFFAIQLLSALHEEHVLWLDESSATWLWDARRIEQRAYADNVVDFMVRRLSGLPRATQDMLQTAACVGSKSPSSILALSRGVSEEEVLADLWDAIHDGLIARLPEGYAFAHDRVQQAAYSLIPKGRRPGMHLTVGRLLLAHTPQEQLGEHVFEVVTQLDLGADLITDPEERARLVALNLRAARNARTATAYASALRYVSQGLALLPSNGWEAAYETSYGLHFERAQCERLSGHVEAAAVAIDELRRHARGRVDKAEVFRLQIDLHGAAGEIEPGARVVRDALSTLYGIELPAHPSEPMLREALEQTWRELQGRPIEELSGLPAMTDPEMRAAAALISTSLPIAYLEDVNLHDLMCCRLVSLSIRHGNSDYSSHGYIMLGAALGWRTGRWDDARRLGDVGLRISEQGGPAHGGGRAAAYFTIGNFIQMWTRPIGEVKPFFYKAFQSGVEYGDSNNACYAAQKIIEMRLIAGDDLAEVAMDADARLEFARRAKFYAVRDAIADLRALTQALRGSPCSPPAWGDPTRDSAGDTNPLRPFFRALCRMIAEFLLGDSATAVALANEASKLAGAFPGQVPVAEYEYFAGLALAAHHDRAPPAERHEILERLRAHLEVHRVWQRRCPETFLHRSVLIAAELARVECRFDDATLLFEQAAASARQNGLVHNEGIACERAAIFHRARGLATIADAYLQRAWGCYLRWGAGAKVAQLEGLHPFLSELAAKAATATFAARTEQLDLLSVVKASQSISSETELDDLLRTLLRVVLEQGGAQRGVLVLRHDRDLFVEAQASIEDGRLTTSLPGAVPVEASLLLPVSVLRYVARTKDAVISDEGSSGTGRFAADAYLARVKPRSLLCMPIVKQAKAIGLLYLENRASAGVFSRQRIAALELLATQAAISVESAQLLSGERAARASAERAERRAALLAETGTVLANSLDYESQLTALARLCVGHLADWCVIDLLEGDTMRRAAGAHARREKEKLMAELLRRYPPSRDSPHLVARVARTGEPLIVPEITDDTLRTITQDEGHARLVRELGAKSAIVVPLVARGQTLGWLNLSSGTPGRYGTSDLELAQDLANRAAIHVDNARLYRASQESVRVRDEFLAIASHELFTPMTALTLSLQALLRKPEVNAELSRLIVLASRQGDRLHTLIGNLLDVTRLEQGRLSLERAPVALGDIVRDVLRSFQADLARAHCDVSVQGEGVVGFWDRRRLDQVLTNLLSNAIKFGSGRPIEISIGRDGGLARLVVADHGIGIEHARLPHVFERFERAVPMQHFGGLGLGLYVCRQIVEAHGGSIRVESQPGAGAKFTVELPCGS